MDILNKLAAQTMPLVPKSIVGKISRRYIAGDSIDDAVRVVRDINNKRIMATLDVLGEDITNREEARHNADDYIKALEIIDKEKLDSNVSLKLTALGLKLDFDFCIENVSRVITRAKESGLFVRIDMEDSTCTTDTIRAYLMLQKKYGNVGIVIQAYLRRSVSDCEKLLAESENLNVRLCKGAYVESRSVVYKDRELIKKNFSLLLTILSSNGAYVGIASHDEEMVWEGLKIIHYLKLPKDAYEFQMLVGVDEELRDIIVNAGHRMRVYVPYGEKWYAYSVRRLKENPEIAGYVIKNLLGIK
ncbi:MAG: proline dehydrogenase family protein [Deltaproteobacteria bacterium]|nr:proline dehydrogenase family protein [Deltaproteobacteria bacterium]